MITDLTSPPSARIGGTVERVQIGARMEKRMVQVLKGLAEFKDMTLGELLEEIVLHSFEPVPGHEGQQCASPHSARSLQAIADLKKVYGMEHGKHDSYDFTCDNPQPE
ncbi:MAG: hypothetical protein H7145_06050 [Akkermansiaceae bacterium]|nr:hypothetical protein [Armatimonadota bacterium]